MNIKRISAAVMAAAVLAVGAPVMGAANPLGVVASAAEEKLVTGSLDAAISEKLTSNNYVNLSKGYYILQDTVSDPNGWWSYQVVNKIIRIGEKEIGQWRTTGKLEPTNIQCDVDVSGMEYWAGNFDNGSYVMFAPDHDNPRRHYYAFKLDEAGGKLTKAYDFVYGSEDSFFETTKFLSSGYAFCGTERMIFNFDYMYTPTGEKIEAKMPEEAVDWVFSDGTGKYAAFASTGNTGVGETGKIYGITKNGNAEEVASRPNSSLYGGTYKYNYAIYPCSEYGTNDNKILIYSSADEKLYEIKLSEGEVYYDVNASAVTVEGSGYYKLIDLNGKDLSKTYALIETQDGGKTYLVQTADGKWGYIDSTGKELAMFDDAGSFNGNGLYAPVVQDGKGWLVDKNMDQVSEKIDATGCTTIGKELFRFETANGNMFATSPEKGTDASAKPGNSGSSDNKTALTDKNSGVSVSGDFPAGTTLKASKTKKSDNTFVVDVSPVDASGNKVQPKGAAVVMAMIPELKGKSVNVYRVTDGNYTKLNSWVDGDGIFFTTSHFSEFEITTEQREESNPNTGAEGTVGLAAAVLISAGVLIVSRKKR